MADPSTTTRDDHRAHALESLGHAAGHAARLGEQADLPAQRNAAVMQGLAIAVLAHGLVFIGDRIGRLSDAIDLLREALNER